MQPTRTRRRRSAPHARPAAHTLLAALLTLSPLIPSPVSHAQVVQDRKPAPIEVPELAPSITRLLEQSYLTPEQARDLRLHHGIWRDEDLASPALRARAALTTARFWDDSLQSPEADPLDRAEALIELGDPAGALALLDAPHTPHPSHTTLALRAARLRAHALFDLGNADDASRSLDRVTSLMADQQITLADEMAEGVRALLLRARMKGPWRDAQQDYRTITTLLARARDELDRLAWAPRLAEAELLSTKDNRREARQAAIETLRLNPSCAAAWRLLGHMSVDQFDFQTSESIAARLDELAGKIASEDTALSPWAAEIRARAQLRQRDAAGAIEILTPALAAHPTMRSLLALRAAASAASFDAPDTDARLASFDALSRATPLSSLALYEVGRTLSDNRQYELSDAFLRRAVEREPHWAEPLIERGLMLAQAGRDVEALDTLRAAKALDPFNVAVDNSIKLLTELLTYQRFESEHFIVRCKPGRDTILAREMLPALEAMHDRVCSPDNGGIDFKPPVRTTIDLMPNHEWFSVRITGMPGLHTMAAATGPIIAMESPSDGPGHLVGPYDWLRVVRHEYTHTVTLARTNNRIPHWFTEAAAVYLEDAPRDTRTVALLANAYAADRLFDLDAINIAFVRPSKPTDRSQAYAQGHWMYQYIVERFGDRAPLDLMDHYAKGTPEEAAFRNVLGLSRADFFTAFKQWAGDQLIAWGARLPPGTPDAQSLIEQAASPAHSPAQAIERALEAHPDHPELLAIAVEAALRERRGIPDPSMTDLLERAAAARPMDDAPHRALARIYLTATAANNPAEDIEARAIPHLEWLDAREVHSPAYAAELARLYAERGDHARAHDKALRVVRIAPFDADSRETAARIAIVAEDYNAARHQLEALIAIEPDRELHKKRLAALEALAKND